MSTDSLIPLSDQWLSDQEARSAGASMVDAETLRKALGEIRRLQGLHARLRERIHAIKTDGHPFSEQMKKEALEYCLAQYAVGDASFRKDEEGVRAAGYAPPTSPACTLTPGKREALARVVDHHISRLNWHYPEEIIKAIEPHVAAWRE